MHYCNIDLWIRGPVPCPALTPAQAAYDALDVVAMNYINLESLTLSHNLLSTIHMKLFKLKLHRSGIPDRQKVLIETKKLF